MRKGSLWHWTLTHIFITAGFCSYILVQNQFPRVTGLIGTPPPSLPDHCVLEVDEKGSENPTWRVTSGAGKVVAEHKEEDLRLSVSCKFHMFTSEEDMDKFYQVGVLITFVMT